MVNDGLALILSVLPSVIITGVMVAVLVLALALRARIGRTACGLTVAGAATLIVVSLFGAWWARIGVMAVYESTSSPDRYVLVGIVSLAQSVVHLIGVGLICAAVFAGRGPAQRAVPVNPVPVMAPPAASTTTDPR